MAKTNEVIIAEIKAFMAKWGGYYSDWYAGIASDPRQRLFNDHNVDEKKDGWIFREAFNSESARSVEDYFVNVLKTSGNTGGGDNTTKFVYAYKKASHTNE
jgi:hypothetical protein